MIIPSDCHVLMWMSRSIMFVDSRYITGDKLCCAAYSWIFLIGDGRVLPFANQFSLSITQKSLSLCVMMACLSVMIISSI